MNTFVYAAEAAYDKKKPRMPDHTCTSSLQLHDIPQDLQNIFSIGEKSDFSMNSIHDNICHETIWWPLQTKWSTCQ